ncbi:autophagy-related protein 13-like, partial [Trifolium medium]|nr:autophagy-related protein 13-like [Trifolium medium]
MEQIITEFFAKSVHIILESRAIYASSRNSYGGYKSDSSSSSSSSSVRPRDKWFNLALRECPVALENINNHECLIVDVILVRRSLDWDPTIPKKYENGKKIKDSNLGTRRSSNNNSLQNLYKKSTLLLRSLYATVRLLPAYKIFRDLNSSAHIRPFTLAHRVSSFVEPFTRKQESEMMKYRFTPVDTSSGRLCLTVMYCPKASDLSCEQLPSMSPQVISDYVGSPLADPLRRFPSLPLAGLPCHGCLSPRRHSWNFDDSKASSTSINDSSLPIHSKSQILLSNTSSRLHDLPPNPHLRGSRCTYKIDRSTNVMQTGATSEKAFSLGKDELQKYSGVRISANSFPLISISSRSYLDDFDDTDFSCPFD